MYSKLHSAIKSNLGVHFLLMKNQYSFQTLWKIEDLLGKILDSHQIVITTNSNTH